MKKTKRPRLTGPLRAYAYMRLSVDKEGGNPQSIEAQRHAIRAYAEARGITIVEEFADAGISGRTDRRPDHHRARSVRPRRGDPRQP